MRVEVDVECDYAAWCHHVAMVYEDAPYAL